VFNGISDDRILAEAAGVTFYALLAIFPTLAALVSLYGLVADPKTISDNLSAVSGVLPGGGMQILQDQVKSLTSKPSSGLGFGAIVGLLTSLWSANAGMKALFDALNVVYEEKERRSFIRRTLLTLAFTVGAIFFIIIAMSGVVVLPAVLGFLGLGQTTKLLLDLLRWPVLIVALMVFLAAVYRYGPSRLQARWRWVSWGGGVATLCWVLVSLAFSYYVSHFGNYNKTYGSLGAAIGFMTWIWLSSSVVLIGAELNAEMEHQTERDSTIGPEKPLGQRDALKANEVAS
jgi:membrane protein